MKNLEDLKLKIITALAVTWLIIVWVAFFIHWYA